MRGKNTDVPEQRGLRGFQYQAACTQVADSMIEAAFPILEEPKNLLVSPKNVRIFYYFHYYF